MYFPTAGIEVFPLAPCAAAFGISLFCSMAGISGAFLLLPYQISVLGYVLPGVSATNHIFNILACPAGVWRYAREGRLLAPLAAAIAIGTLPGVFIGAILRLTILTRPQSFMLFVAAVLFYLSIRILRARTRAAHAAPCHVLAQSWRGFRFELGGAEYAVRSWPLFWLSFGVGIIGGVYGIGGGAIMSPFLATSFGLPIYAISGACLFATFLTSLAGVAFYSFLAFFWQIPWAAPDWALGALFGIGGIFGMYCGAGLQKFIPARYLRLLLFAILFYLAIHYSCKGLGT